MRQKKSVKKKAVKSKKSATPAAKSKPLSLPQFAKFVGVTHTAIKNALTQQRIVTGVRVTAKGRKYPKYEFYDPDAAKQEYLHFTARLPEKLTGERNGKERAAEVRDENGKMSAQEANRLMLEYKALNEKLEYEKDSSLLVETSKVEKTWNDIAHSLRAGVMAIPDRTAPLLVGKMSQHEIYQIMLKEFTQALTLLSNEITEKIKS